MNHTFNVSSQSDDGVALITVNGEIDIATAPALRAELASPHMGSTVIVDLTGVTFLDSTALGVLVSARKTCREVGADFRLVLSEPRILKVFEITGLTSVFSISPTLEEARNTPSDS
jgi:anti-sigma B factor antagonist